jgi:hypothetical protein
MATRITQRTAHRAASLVSHPSLSVEESSEDLTIWAADLDGREVLETAADSVSEALGGCPVTICGGKAIVHWKRPPVDMGDPNDPSSHWHY